MSHCGVTTFSILDLTYHFQKIDLLDKTSVNLKKLFSFPSHHKAAQASSATPHIPVTLPEDYEIEAAVLAAFQEALDISRKFKIIQGPNPSPPTMKLNLTTLMEEENIDFNDDVDGDVIEVEMEEEVDLEDVFLEDETEADVAEDLFIISSGSLGMKKFNDVRLSETRPFVLVGDGFKEPAIIRKSTLCWFLAIGDTKLSSDRLVRVQAAPVNHSSKKKVFSAPSVEETISVGDWCAFVSENNSICIGRILAFSYQTGSSKRNIEFSLLSAPVEAPKANARGLDSLCSWFSLNRNTRVLTSMTMIVHGYYSIEHYICSLPRPELRGTQLLLPCSVKQISLLRKN